MKPVNPGSRRRKIILYYILAVVLPGIFLGYMAFRGIRNDQALREKESRKKLETNSQTFFAAIDSSFVQFMNKHTADSILFSPRQGDSSMLALFVTDASGSKKLIAHQLLFLPAELLAVKPEELNPPVSLKEGLRLEFIGNRFPEALRFYQDMNLQTADTEEKIQAMVASARLYNKMNQPARAKDLYDKIRKDYPGRLLNGQIPLGLIAGLEILKITLSIGDKEEISDNSRNCLELLLHPRCEYGVNQFDLFYQSFKEIIPETDRVTDSLFDELDIQRARTGSLIRMLTGPEPDADNGNNHLKGDNGISIIPVNSAELAAVYLSCSKNDDLQTVMVIDFLTYMKSISDKLIQKLDPDYSINIKIEDNNGRVIFSRIIGESAGYLSFPFPKNLPEWKLLLSENKPGFIATLLKAGSGNIFLFLFLLLSLWYSVLFLPYIR